MFHYINIHTHQSQNKSYTEIINLFPENAEKIISENPHSLFSVGLYPWHIGENADALLKEIEKLSTCGNVVAIGETGLDKLSETDFTKQTEVFNAQIRIAEKAQKPLIIHCVKAYQEVFSIKKELQVNVPMIFHGFRRKPELAEQILHQNGYISVGANAEYIPETIQKIPLNRLFIETDESNVDISEIYKKIAGIKNISVEKLAQQIQSNFETVFQQSANICKYQWIRQISINT